MASVQSPMRLERERSGALRTTVTLSSAHSCCLGSLRDSWGGLGVLNSFMPHFVEELATLQDAKLHHGAPRVTGVRRMEMALLSSKIP